MEHATRAHTSRDSDIEDAIWLLQLNGITCRNAWRANHLHRSDRLGVAERAASALVLLRLNKPSICAPANHEEKSKRELAQDAAIV